MAPFAIPAGKATYKKAEPSEDDHPISGHLERVALPIYPSSIPEKHAGKTNGKREEEREGKGRRELAIGLRPWRVSLGNNTTHMAAHFEGQRKCGGHRGGTCPPIVI